jgi:hypothetical protein
VWVHPDQSAEDDPAPRAARLRARVAAARGVPGLEEVRAILIEAGMLEQATWDGPPWAPGTAAAGLAATRTATLAAAGALVALERGGRADAAVRWLARADQALASLPAPRPGATVTVRLPRGYAHHALFPEQYIAAARAWLATRGGAGTGPVLVVGLRTIGTSLSAVVHATLASRGATVRSLTVRPEGPPFARTVRLDPAAAQGAAHALVVDEGPGLSGSSLAATAAALEAAGCARITLMPGHAHGPGPAAPAEVRERWAGAAVCTASLDRVRLAGHPLLPAVAVAAGVPVAGRAGAIDLGEGRWRALHHEDPSAWPAVCGRFERPKFLMVARDGRRVLLRFAGLVAPDGHAPARREHERLTARAGGGALVLAPLGQAHGFVLSEWRDARPLSRADATPAVLTAVGAHVARCARPEADPGVFAAALARAGEALALNAREALGPGADAAVARLHRRAAACAATTQLAGDGRLAPHEWLRAADGRLLKSDAAGHDDDRVGPGAQPVAWDLAGAQLEWGLADGETSPLLEGFRSAGGAVPPAAALDFHAAAYAATRLGAFRLCAAAETSPGEAARLASAAGAWRDALALRLEAAAP